MAATFSGAGTKDDPWRLKTPPGTGDFDTRVMEVTKGRMVSKRGGAALGCNGNEDCTRGIRRSALVGRDSGVDGALLPG